MNAVILEDLEKMADVHQTEQNKLKKFYKRAGKNKLFGLIKLITN
jgi:hypothetical protein